MSRRWWVLDGGVGDHHRIMQDAEGNYWGWENVRPRDPVYLFRALEAGIDKWHGYVVTEVADPAA